MKSSLRKKFLLAICSLFLCNTNIFPAITKGTLVHTPSGFVPVENLHIGDFVIGYCLDCKNLVQSPIIKIKKKKIDTLFLVKTDNKELLVSKQHLFFDPTKHLWIKAKSLTNKNYLASCSFDSNHLTLFRLRCHGVTKLKQSVNTYEIGLKFPHTFLVSQSQILTHNFALSLTSFGAYFAFGLGSISLKSIGIGVACLGIGIVNFFAGKSKNKTHIILNPCNLNNLPNDPDDENNKEREFKITKNDAHHIFRKKENHLLYDTPDNRKLLFDLVSDPENFLIEDIYGKKWYAKILDNGKQLWATVRGNSITGGGLNKIPRNPHPKTGLSRPFPPKIKL